ncbi:hypothetical protein PMI08_04231 [Brevibacillus sp. CF112]|uniref:Uncharacterized protein n=1 Tax=Brevibacillus fulvus TaxID=1125967 RepID=A0A939BSX9_9BACL|nr:hypothetical protein PMI08_04231 [Brevibacillus sp. CF112]MBM7591212.1 hypothetical protein [Brevibacillus fulvus]
MNLAEVKAWRDAAVADGWDIEPIYETESVETAARLGKEGFTAVVYARNRANRYDQSVCVWGPDRLSVKVPTVYDWDYIKSGLEHCEKCPTIGPTVGLAFANRVCPACRAKYEAQYAGSGWAY